MKHYYSIIFLLLCFSSQAQDVWLQNYLQPNSGCNLGNSNVVVLVNNNSAAPMGSNTITVSYKLDGGATVSQLLGSTLFAGATWTFTFSTQANLAGCGNHTLKCWVSRPGDPNHLNDTILWNVQNDCTVVPGSVGVDQTVCPGTNAGTLNLTGWTNGTISGWESSTDGGSTWSPISNTTTSENFSNLTQTTNYRVQIEGGYCPDATSMPATVTVQPAPVAGTISGADTLCVNAVSGSLTLSGNSGSVQQWESSIDNGATWTVISNTTTSQSYSGITQTTWYRALSGGGTCPSVYSDTAIMQIYQLLGAITVLGSDTLCITSGNGALTVNPGGGNVIAWEYSTDGGTTWTGISNPTTTENYSLTQSTWYRVLVSGGECPNGISDTGRVIIQNLYPAVTVNSSDTLCISSANGILSLAGMASAVLDWETSLNNLSFTSTGQQTTTFDYSGQTQTTWYRAFIEGDACPDYYSDTAVIAIDSLPVPGILTQDTTVCYGSPIFFDLAGAMGDSVQWQSNVGLGWSDLLGADSMSYTQSATQSSIFRVAAFSGVCPPLYSNTVIVDVNPLPTVNAGIDVTINEGDSVQLSGVGGAIGIWTPGGSLSDSTIAQPYASPNITTIYTYHGLDINGCIGTDDVVITVLDPIVFTIRNVVTRNNDNINDTWFIRDIEYFDNTAVKVFNEYGDVVYENSNYDNSWKGDYQGKMLPAGTYLYVVTKADNGETFQGTLTLLGGE